MTHPSRQFFFRCKSCGEYPTTEETFFKFLSADEEVEVESRLKEGARGALIEFFECCPRCEEKRSSTKKIVILWPPGKRGHWGGSIN